MVDALESRLNDNMWLGGQQPSKEDAEEFAKLGGKLPNCDSHPNTYAWYSLVSKFTDAVRSTWTAAAAAGVSIHKYLLGYLGVFWRETNLSIIHVGAVLVLIEIFSF